MEKLTFIWEPKTTAMDGHQSTTVVKVTL